MKEAKTAESVKCLVSKQKKELEQILSNSKINKTSGFQLLKQNQFSFYEKCKEF